MLSLLTHPVCTEEFKTTVTMRIQSDTDQGIEVMAFRGKWRKLTEQGLRSLFPYQAG